MSKIGAASYKELYSDGLWFIGDVKYPRELIIWTLELINADSSRMDRRPFSQISFILQLKLSSKALSLNDLVIIYGFVYVLHQFILFN